MLLPRLTGDFSIETLDDQRRVQQAVAFIVDDLSARLDERIIGVQPGARGGGRALLRLRALAHRPAPPGGDGRRDGGHRGPDHGWERRAWRQHRLPRLTLSRHPTNEPRASLPRRGASSYLRDPGSTFHSRSPRPSRVVSRHPPACRAARTRFLPRSLAVPQYCSTCTRLFQAGNNPRMHSATPLANRNVPPSPVKRDSLPIKSSPLHASPAG